MAANRNSYFLSDGFPIDRAFRRDARPRMGSSPLDTNDLTRLNANRPVGLAIQADLFTAVEPEWVVALGMQRQKTASGLHSS